MEETWQIYKLMFFNSVQKKNFGYTAVIYKRAGKLCGKSGGLVLEFFVVTFIKKYKNK